MDRPRGSRGRGSRGGSRDGGEHPTYTPRGRGGGYRGSRGGQSGSHEQQYASAPRGGGGYRGSRGGQSGSHEQQYAGAPRGGGGYRGGRGGQSGTSGEHYTSSPRGGGGYRGGRGGAAGGSDEYEDLECAVIRGVENITISTIPRAEDLGTPPLRPGLGTLGRKIDLIANHFEIEFPRGHIYQYDLSIKNVGTKVCKSNQGKNGLSKNVCKLVFEELDKKYRKILFEGMIPAFDGLKNVILRNKLSEDKYDLRISKVKMDNGEADFDVTLKYSATIDLDPLHKLFTWVKANQSPENQSKMLVWKERNKDALAQAIMGLNVVLRHGPLFNLVPMGRSFFIVPEPGECHPLSGGREVWHGYHQSLRPGWKPFVVINKIMTTFYKPNQNLVEFVAEFLGKDKESMDGLNDRDIKKLNKELKNIKVEVTHLPYKRKFTIKSCSSKSARQITFELDDGRKRTITVEEYFRMTYRKTLEFPNLPCIEVGQGKFLPMEVCQLVAKQHCKSKLTSQQTAEMIKVAAVRPLERFAAIRDLVQDANNHGKDILREFDVVLSEDPANIIGRVLNSPQIQYQVHNQSNRIHPRDGVWDMRNKQFQKGAEIKNWALLSFAEKHLCKEHHLRNLVELIYDISENAGLHLGPCAETFEGTYSRPGDAKNILEDLKKKEFELVVIITPEAKNQECYSEIKTVADTMIGLVTQCVRCKTVTSKKCDAQLASNLCLKINAKLGGINGSPVSSFLPQINEKPIIYMGADVTHPSPDDKISPSVAAVVGSLDGYPSQHAVEIKVQKEGEEIKSRVEIILELKDMVKSLLYAFFVNTHKKPEKIIFYRDGVSEGQFREVRNYEIQAIRKACSELQSDYEPKLTFIIVQKRHHTRFYPGNPREGGKTGNVPAGTVVDQSITHPSDFDFFLCSHYGLQGTSRPTHYFVLWDDNDYDADTLQAMTYCLCHAYVRCTRSISIPAQVMYAHLAAFRARYYLKSGTLNNVDISKVVRAAKALAKKMYFV